MVRIKSVTPLQQFTVRLGFTDGTEKDVDLAPYLTGSIFDPLRNDPLLFRAVRVDEAIGTIVWPNGADIDPDTLYFGLRPADFKSEQRG